MHMLLLRRLLVALLFLVSNFVHAAGFSLIEVPADRDGPALQGAVWTPCAQPPADGVELGRVRLAAVRDCPIASGGPRPLIVLSHGYGGSFLGHHDTAQALADAGFVVATITHSGDNFRLRGGPDDSIVALATRTVDIRRLIDFMLGAWPAHERLDADKVGFYGFSRGGYTGLVLVGAEPDFERLPPRPSSPCAVAPQGPDCVTMRRRFQSLLSAPLAHDARIKAAVIVDPFNAVFTAAGLARVRSIPIQLWASATGGDGVTPESVEGVRRSLPVVPDWHVAAGASHFSFLAPCSAAQREAAPELCADPAGFDRTAFHAELNERVLAFLKQHLASAARP